MSRLMSNGRFFLIAGVTAYAVFELNSIVWPSGAARTTASAPHHPARAGAVIDEERLPAHLAEMLRHNAGDNIRRAACRKWHDHAHRPHRIGAPARRRAPAPGRRCGARDRAQASQRSGREPVHANARLLGSSSEDPRSIPEPECRRE
jgi:hypothetical protein